MKKQHSSVLYTFALLAVLGLFATTTACSDELILDGMAENRGGAGSHDLPPGVSVGELITCDVTADCLSDEACSQGGYCVNITGERDATAVIQRDLDELNDAVGNGVPYKLPPNAILLFHDLNGNGVALDIDRRVLFDGNGSLLRVENDKVAIAVSGNAMHSRIANLRIDPQNPDVVNDGIGVDVRTAGVRLDNIVFWSLGTGVRAHGTPEAEVFSQQWSQLVFENIHHNATDIDGTRAHGGAMIGFEISESAGLLDSSDSGNLYVGMAFNNARNHSLILDSENSFHTVAGVNLSAQSPSMESHSEYDLHIGGNAVADLKGPGERVGNQAASLHFLLEDEDQALQVRIPGNDHAAFSFSHSEEAKWWYVRYFGHSSERRWGISYENTATAPFFWTSGDHPDGPGYFEEE